MMKKPTPPAAGRAGAAGIKAKAASSGSSDDEDDNGAAVRPPAARTATFKALAESSDEDSDASAGDAAPRQAAPAMAAAAAKPRNAAAPSAAAAGSAAKSSESSSSDDEDEGGRTARAPRFDFKADSESDEDTNRVMKSAKDKALDAVGKASKELQKLLKTGEDWVGIKDAYLALAKVYDKSVKALSNAPETFLEALVALETAVTRIADSKDLQKKLSKARYKAWSAVHIRYTKAKPSEPFRAELEAFRSKREASPAASAAKGTPTASSTVAGGTAATPAALTGTSTKPRAKAAKSSSSSSASSSSGSSSSSSSDSSGSSSSSSSSSGSSSSSSSSSSSGEEDEDEDDEESDSQFGKGDDDDASSSSSSSADEPGREKLVGRAKWVKRVAVKADESKRLTGTEQAAADEDKRRRKTLLAAERRAELIKEEAERRAREAAVVLTADDVERLVAATVSRVWKPQSNRRELTEQLRAHASRAVPHGPSVLIPTLMHLIASQLDTKGIDDYVPLDRWRQAVGDLLYLLRILDKNPHIRLVPASTEQTIDVKAAAETVEDILAEAARAANGDAQLARARAAAAATERARRQAETGADPNVVPVVGDLSVFAARLQTEYVKALRAIAPHEREYALRMAEEATMLDLAEKVQVQLERFGDHSGAAKQALMRVEIYYYKHDSLAWHHSALESARTVGSNPHPASWVNPTALATRPLDPSTIHPGNFVVSVVRSGGVAVGGPGGATTTQLIDQLCSVVYKYGDESAKVRAILCQIYHHALHDRYHQARDLLLMSRLQETVNQAEVDTQVLYNRTMVQIGMSAFRTGLMSEAHDCLTEICGSKMREMLAQGMSWKAKNALNRDPEREAAERRRLVPYHQHINLQLVDLCHLVSAMVLEIPVIAREEVTLGAPQPVSRSFRKYLDAYQRQVFTGPPENVRDTIMASSLALKSGDWKAASELIVSLSLWSSVHDSPRIKRTIEERLKREALRTYLFTTSAHYESVRVESLCSLFALESPEVRLVVSKMILSRELQASWDADCVVVTKVLPTHLQSLALKFADKTRELVEYNERQLERLTGGGGGGGGGDGEVGGRGPRGGYEDNRGGADRGGQSRRRYDNPEWGGGGGSSWQNRRPRPESGGGGRGGRDHFDRGRDGDQRNFGNYRGGFRGDGAGGRFGGGGGGGSAPNFVPRGFVSGRTPGSAGGGGGGRG